MDLSVVNNLTSFKAQTSLAQNTKALSKSLKSLSTGLRVNGAADDPSGLAISERFRAQTRGLARASLNAQDGISMLQTAEGALNEVHSILQRTRELAVQAANGVLTSSDRQEIQREVDQLKEEIDRIADTTEFNTRKLLNGHGSALWSSSSSEVTAVVTGKVDEGNYKLEVSPTEGQNHVLKTDIMRVAEGKIAALDDGSPLQIAFNISNMTGAATAEGTITIVMGSETLTVNIATINEFDGATAPAVPLNGGNDTAWSIVNAINNSTLAAGKLEAFIGPTIGDVMIRVVDKNADASDYSISFTHANNDSATISAWNGTTAAWDTQTTFADIHANGATGQSFITEFASDSASVANLYDVEGLDAGDWDIITMTESQHAGVADSAKLMGAFLNPTTNVAITEMTAATTENRYLMVEVTESGGSGAVDLRVSWDQGENWTLVADYASAANIQMEGTAANQVAITFTGDFEVGDKLLIGVQDSVQDATDVVYLQGPASTFENLADPVTTFSDNVAADAVHYQTGLWVDTGTSDASGSTGHELTTAWMDNTGTVHFGQVSMDFGDNFTATSAINTSVNVTGAGGVASSGTKLEDVDRFYDANGQFILGDNGKWLDIFNGAGDKASVFIEGKDTLDDVRDKIAQAIARDETTYGWSGLGMGDVLSNGVSKAATYVQNSESGDEAVAGTMVIRSTKMGTEGELTFNAEEAVLNALSLNTIQDAENAETTVKVYEAHTSVFIAEETVGDNTLHNVIAGVDVKISTTAGISAEWNATTGKIDFTASDSEHYIHLVDKSMDLQIGANQGQMMSSYVGEISTEGLGIDNMLVVSQDHATNAIGKIDEAVQKVSSERARIGAYINRLDHTLNNLAVQEENQTAAESSIRDLNMAKGVTEMTKYQILQQVSTAMLGQGNTISQTVMSLIR